MARLTVAVGVGRGGEGFHRLVGAVHRKNLTVVSLAYFEDEGEQVVVVELDTHARDADVALAAIEREPSVESIRSLAMRPGQLDEVLGTLNSV